MIEKLKNYPMLIGIKYASELGLSRYQFNKLLRSNDVPTVRIGSKLYFDRDRLIVYFENQSSKEKTNEV